MSSETKDMKDMLRNERMIFIDREDLEGIRRRRTERVIADTIALREECYGHMGQEQFDRLIEWIRSRG